jgi:rubrerythrin
MTATIATVEEFYAHALAMEREAAERYSELAAWFDARDASIAQLCRRLARLEHEHFSDLAEACSTLELPDVAAEDYRWAGAGSPETTTRDLFDRITSPRELLQTAHAAELRAQAFFVEIARTAPQRGVRELAAIMAAEEGEHARWLRDALDDLGAPS